MSLQNVKDFFMWASILNFSLLILSVALQYFARNFLITLVKIIFNTSAEKTTDWIFAAIVFQKIITYVFFIVPFIALSLIS